MHKDRLGRPLSVGDRILIMCTGSPIYTYYATITRFIESRIYTVPEGSTQEHCVTSTLNFINVEDQLAANREQFPEYYI